MKPTITDLINKFNKYHRDAMIEETPNGVIYYAKPNSNAIGYEKVFEIEGSTIIQYTAISIGEYIEFYKFLKKYIKNFSTLLDI